MPDVRGWEGMIAPPNINLTNRPRVVNPDGSISTVRSITVGFDNAVVVLPTVTDDGKIESNDAAIKRYLATGKHLGMFKTQEQADRYAQGLHVQQAKTYLR